LRPNECFDGRLPWIADVAFFLFIVICPL